MNTEKIAVIGSGTMGNGIAHTFAQNDFRVYLIDISEELLNKAINTISKNLDRQVQKGVITEEIKINTLANIVKLTDLNELPSDLSLIIEAVNENKSVKMDILIKLKPIINEKTVIATNTSSISITELAKYTNPANFVGMHFMNPVPIMKLVEIIRGYKTSDDTVKFVSDLAKRINKIPIEVNDYPGFISNRVLMPMINEAIYAYYEGVASIDAIDQIMKLGMNHPMGPLTLADFIGLDVCLSIMEVLYEGFNDTKYRPCPLLKKMVASGNLGRKTGEGFYKY